MPRWMNELGWLLVVLCAVAVIAALVGVYLIAKSTVID